MSVEGQLFYRSVYLKSDKWQAVRLEVLVREKGLCQICGKESISNDAHHIWYPESIWDTKPHQLVVLCRSCHTFLHAMHPAKVSDRDEGWAEWKKLQNAICRWRRDTLVLFGTSTGVHFQDPRELRKELSQLKEKLRYYEWLHSATCVNSFIAESDYQI